VVSGEWQITPLGTRFLSGEAMIQRWVITLNNKVVEFEGELVSVETILPYTYDQREDYAKRK
jgi:hypothetical protein